MLVVIERWFISCGMEIICFDRRRVVVMLQRCCLNGLLWFVRDCFVGYLYEDLVLGLFGFDVGLDFVCYVVLFL